MSPNFATVDTDLRNLFLSGMITLAHYLALGQHRRHQHQCCQEAGSLLVLAVPCSEPQLSQPAATCLRPPQANSLPDISLPFGIWRRCCLFLQSVVCPGDNLIWFQGYFLWYHCCLQPLVPPDKYIEYNVHETVVAPPTPMYITLFALPPVSLYICEPSVVLTSTEILVFSILVKKTISRWEPVLHWCHSVILQ